MPEALITAERVSHFYGSGGPHSCYDREMEERRYVTEHPIPAGQLDTVLGTLDTVIQRLRELDRSLNNNGAGGRD